MTGDELIKRLEKLEDRGADLNMEVQLAFDGDNAAHLVSVEIEDGVIYLCDYHSASIDEGGHKDSSGTP